MDNNTTTVKNILKKTGIVLSIVGIISLSIIYVVQQKLTNNEQIQEATAIAEIIKHSIYINTKSIKTKEHLIDLHLYSISKAIGDSLAGRTIDQVSNEELVALKEKWDLYDISLFVKRGDSLVVEKSSDPRELGLDAITWGFWYDAMIQLYNLEPVTIKHGYAQDNYWAGPMSLSEITDEHFKYVYYYDESLEFIINPYIAADNVYELISNSNTNSLIEKIKETSYYNVKEIAVINKDAFLHPREVIVEPERDLPVLYGTNNYALKVDEQIISTLSVNDSIKMQSFTEKGRQLSKLFIALNDRQILTVVIDTSKYNVLAFQFLSALLGIFALAFIVVAIVLFMMNKKSYKILEAEQERLAIAEDFKRTMELLPEAIFKLKKTHDETVIINYNEGTLIEELAITTDQVRDKHAKEIYPAEIWDSISSTIQQGFSGKEVQCYFSFRNKIYQLFIKPTYKNEIAGYAVDVTKEKEAEQKIEKLALYDTLTKLPNRYYFKQRVEQLLLQSQGTNSNFALFYIDLDNFKMINDTKGHTVGDQLLIIVAERMLKSLANTPSFLARMGGDEFTLLIESFHNRSEIANIAEHLLNSFNDPFFLHDNEYTITASIGISLFPNDGSSINVLLKNADIAMYRAKDKNKNAYAFFEENMGEQEQRKVNLSNALRQAITNQELYLQYQPQYNVESKSVTGVEALLRWQHPEYGSISPDEFIPLAEKSNLIHSIGEWVLKEACSQFKKWEASGISLEKMSVNLSKIQLLDQKILLRITDILQETNFNPENLTFEITESATVDNIDSIIHVLETIRALGITIAIDDFGIEHSSLKYLKNIPLDIIKIDRSFISELELDKKNESIVTLIIGFATQLGLKVIAEGVETAAQNNILQRLGCQEIQGYYYSRPLVNDDLLALLKETNSHCY